ncbi:LacI family DNA-binding transcriptional regulator [Ramlibacter sp. USB13]|uniref:LacI family DNA-binding transcriptional regulator n=1 Tax=Ramlibacter cellulosilyticus TaxID=2764187 RepID=A0A923MPN4_9BURK|nr:LacI family DNA-binding transcriptional regulator [Ramlibacter cellulosilyticus]MBC5781552.1 LacI family DNA-binding transcriptional regulator [Ramlibacter cellulosilyticus]
MPSRKASAPVTTANRGPTAKATIRDVAALAGVSLMTVSRAMKQPQQLAPETLARVRAAMDQVGYVPNMAAVSLRLSQTRLVAAIVPTLATHVFDTMLAALTAALAKEGYEVLIGQTQYQPGREVDLVRTTLGRRPDGILVTGSVQDKTVRNLLAASGIPVIEAGDLVRNHVDMAVGMSNEKLGAAVCSHLAGLGHQRLAIFSGDDDRAQRRNKAFAREAARLGLPPVHVVLVPPPTSHPVGRKLMADLLDHGPRVDAIYCGSDMTAAGVLSECRERGIAVPGEIAVIGTGDTDFAQALYPPLTSVRVDGARIGECAAAMFLERFAGKPQEQKSVDVGFTIVERESTRMESSARQRESSRA